MDKLPKIIYSYINALNDYDMKGYLNTFSHDAIIKEKSLGQTLVAKREIEHYFETYFINYQTQTEIIEFEVSQNIIHIKVQFTGNFPEEQINGLFKFTLNHSGLISILEADLE
ncbi:hypothetical protein [Niallia sp. FSL W8-0635]|uniref:hypothetical protein n=1 Tax=Niallia sp. FSL W8-0635 TaxID=2975337 RepID=UPI0009C4ACFF|nr:Uncharacterised protein [Mycobacteroides abscessus subsp. abscessus]HEO8421995.1 hypothetical protein [Yersinia enterocolitica]